MTHEKHNSDTDRQTFTSYRSYFRLYENTCLFPGDLTFHSETHCVFSHLVFYCCKCDLLKANVEFLLGLGENELLLFGSDLFLQSV